MHDKPRWNVESTLDESRETGPKITQHPGVNTVRAESAAKACEEKWRPVNERFFHTTTTNTGTYGRREEAGTRARAGV